MSKLYVLEEILKIDSFTYELRIGVNLNHIINRQINDQTNIVGFSPTF